MLDHKPDDSRVARTLGIGLTLSLLLLGPAYGQDAESIEVQIAEPPASALSDAQRAAGPIEEVIVTGQRTIGALLREGAELTENFYMRLNIVLDRDEFRIDCSNEFPTGSRISTRICRMRFQEDLLNRQSVSVLQGVSTSEDGQTIFSDNVTDIRGDMMRMMMEFEDVVVEAVNVDPVLNEQVLRMIAVKSAVDNFETPREQRRRERREDEAFDD